MLEKMCAQLTTLKLSQQKYDVNKDAQVNFQDVGLKQVIRDWIIINAAKEIEDTLDNKI